MNKKYIIAICSVLVVLGTLMGSLSWATPRVIDDGLERFAVMTFAPFLVGFFVVGLLALLFLVVRDGNSFGN